MTADAGAPACSVVFLTYNEAAGIRATLEEALRDLEAMGLLATTEVIVVDNASSDGTAALVEALAGTRPQLRLVRHPSNLGYAVSTLTGFREARGGVVVHVDGDGQLSLRDLPGLLDAIDRGYDVVYGRRRRRRDPLIRIPLSIAFNLLARLWLGWPYHDINIGYRAVTRDVAAAVRTAIPVNFFGPELWVLARRHGWRVTEVPVDQFPRRAGRSLHELPRLPRAVGRALRYMAALRRELRAGRATEVRA